MQRQPARRAPTSAARAATTCSIAARCNTAGTAAATVRHGNRTCRPRQQLRRRQWTCGGRNVLGNGTCNQTAGTPPASSLYNDPVELAKYDMTIFECVGGAGDEDRDRRPRTSSTTRTAAVACTRRTSATSGSTTRRPGTRRRSWVPQTASWNTITADLDTTFGKGQAFAQWLNIVGGLDGAAPGDAAAVGPPADHDRRGASRRERPGARRQGAALALHDGDERRRPRRERPALTFNTDLNKPADQQCGRVLFSDFHVSTGSNTATSCSRPSATTTRSRRRRRSSRSCSSTSPRA